MRPSTRQTLVSLLLLLLLVAQTMLVSWHAVGAQDEPVPIPTDADTPFPTPTNTRRSTATPTATETEVATPLCVTVEPDSIGCLAPAVTAQATATVTPVLSPPFEPTPTATPLPTATATPVSIATPRPVLAPCWPGLRSCQFLPIGFTP